MGHPHVQSQENEEPERDDNRPDVHFVLPKLTAHLSDEAAAAAELTVGVVRHSAREQNGLALAGEVV